MTPDEIESEKIKSLASACFSEWSILQRSQNYLEQITTKHWDHPEFQRYMQDMGLRDEFAKYRR